MSETRANAENDARGSQQAPPWLWQGRQREAAELRRLLTVVELVCIVAVVAAFIWLLKDADLYVGAASAVWFAPVAIALYGARKTGTLERRLARAEAAADTALASVSHEATTAEGSLAAGGFQGPGERGGRRGGFAFARLAWIGFVALTVALATVGFQASGGTGDNDDSEEDGAVVSGQRL